MGKLLKVQLKQNIKTLLLVWLIPLILASGFMILNRFIDNPITEFWIGLSVFLMFIGVGISQIIVIYKDYERFFGKEAGFYESLPISSSNIIWSRFFQYLIMIAILFLILVFDLFIIRLADGYLSMNELKEGFEMTKYVFGKIPGKYVPGIIISFVIYVVFTIYEIIFSINVGSIKNLKSMGFFGPIVIFIAVNVVRTLIFILILINIEHITGYDAYLLSRFSPQSPEEFFMVTKNFFIIAAFIQLVFSIIFGFVSKHIQEKKLSI